MSLVDLHIHSYYSDGTMSPAEILEKAIEQKVTVLAISDHDKLEGTNELIELAKGKDIKCISGVELDALEDNINFHILGYGVDLNDQVFKQRVQHNRNLLDEVNTKLIEKMEQDYDNISVEDYNSFTYNRELGGWKALHYFIEKGLTENLLDGFSIYNKYNHPNTCVDFSNIKEVCNWIHDAGGKAVLAHPGKVVKFKNLEEFERKVEEMLDSGIDGIECYYPTHSVEMTQVCLEICEKRKLLITSGSDCHGDFQDTEIGQPYVEVDKVNLMGL